MTDTERYEKAKRRVEAKFSFYVHAAVYVAVNILLAIINLTTSPEVIWFIWSLLGWGIGLAFHGAGVFYGPKTSAMKEKMIQDEIDRLGRD